jgi:hypothetical protein
MRKVALSAADNWAIAFTARLRELQPTMDLARTIDACQSMQSKVGHADPGNAAELYAESYMRPG